MSKTAKENQDFISIIGGNAILDTGIRVFVLAPLGWGFHAGVLLVESEDTKPLLSLNALDEGPNARMAAADAGLKPAVPSLN